MEEMWKDIPGYEGVYRISNLGRVLSLSREVHQKRNGQIEIRISKSRYLKFGSDGDGYLQIKLFKNGVYKTRKIHRLVAEAFIQNPNNLPEVNHKDENKQNNRSDNLEWSDRDYNIHYGTWVERSRNHRPVAQYSLDGVFIKQFNSIREASRETGVYASNIGKCASGRTYKGYYLKSAGGYKWKFV